LDSHGAIGRTGIKAVGLPAKGNGWWGRPETEISGGRGGGSRVRPKVLGMAAGPTGDAINYADKTGKRNARREMMLNGGLKRNRVRRS